MDDSFEAALTELLERTTSTDTVTRTRAAGEIGKLLQANNQPIHEPNEPRFYDREIRAALRARLLTEDEEARILRRCRDAFLTVDPEHTEGRVWFISALKAGRPELTTALLSSLLVEHGEDLEPMDGFIAVMALFEHLIAWSDGPRAHTLRQEIARADPRPTLERLAGSSGSGDSESGTASSSAAMTLRHLETILAGPQPVPPGGRFRVRFGDEDEPRDIVAVWAEDTEAAVRAAVSFIRALDVGEPSTKHTTIERIGDEPQPSDLGVARRFEDIDHIYLDRDGRRRSTRYHVEISDLAEMTTAFRTGRVFVTARDELRAVDVEPDQVVVMALAPDDQRSPPRLIVVVGPDERVWTWRGPQTDTSLGIPSGWEEDDVTILDLYWRRLLRAAKSILHGEGRKGRATDA